MIFAPGDRVQWATKDLIGTVVPDEKCKEWPGLLAIQWDNGDRTLSAPTHLKTAKSPDASPKSVRAEENTPSKEQIQLKSSNTSTIPTGYEQAEPGSPVFLANVTEGHSHHIYREFDRSTNEYKLHFELDPDRDMSPSEAIAFAQTILQLAVPMQADQITRATAMPSFPSWAETCHYEAETDTLSGRGPSIHLKGGRQQWDLHSNWFEGGDEQFTLAKRCTGSDNPAEAPDEHFSFDSREEVMTVMAGLANLLAAITEGAK